VRIGIIQKGVPRSQSEGDGQAAAERLDQATMRMRAPEREQVRNLPSLSAGPFERRTESRFVGNDWHATPV
jgi:hypothetical protein